MELNGITLTKIEESLLNRELNILSIQLSDIGKQIAKVFSKYGTSFNKLKTDPKDAINVWLKAAIFMTEYTCSAELHREPLWIYNTPDGVKAAILKVVVTEFIERVASIEEIAAEVNRQ